MKSKLSVAYVIGSGILWGTISIFIRKLSAGGFDAMQISLIRMIVSAVVFSVVIATAKSSLLKIKLKDIPLFIGTGIVSVVLFNCCYFYTMVHSQASVAVVLLYTSPVFIMILSAILFKEKFTVPKVLALVLTVVGCVFVSGLIGNDYKIKPFVLLMGLGAGLFYALYTIFSRYALEKYESSTVTAYTFIFGLIGSVFIGKPIETIQTFVKTPYLIIWAVGIGIFCTVLPYFLYTRGLTGMDSGRAAILVAVEPLVGAVIGIAVFRESCSPLKIIGTGLICAAIVILNIPSKSIKSKEIKIIERTLNIGADTPFSILHMSDNHLCLADNRDVPEKVKLANKRRKSFESNSKINQDKNSEELFEYVKKSGMPLIHTGDMIDFVSVKNLEETEKLFSGIDVIMCAGNHEFSQFVGEAWEDEEYKQKSLHLVEKYLPKGIEFGVREINGIKFITIDDSYYYILPEHLEKLKEEVKDGKPYILVLHNPIYSKDIYQQVMKGKPVDEPPYLTGCPDELLTNLSEDRHKQQRTDKTTEEFVEFCNSSANLKGVLAGHLHEGFVSETDAGVCQLVAEGAYMGTIYKVNII